MSRPYDLIIFGVTSFTGKYLLREVIKVLETKSHKKFSWAVASRSSSKIAELLKKVENETGKSLGKVDKIEADVANPASIREMTKKCKVLLNLTGPYTEIGEVVVKACIETGTHYLDLSGEPINLMRVEDKYGKMAEERNCYIIGACGFKSVPSDLGGEVLCQKFGGFVNSLEAIVTMGDEENPNMYYSTGIFHSIVLAIHNLRETLSIKKKLYDAISVPLPTPKFKLSSARLEYKQEIGAWCMHVPFPDEDVMERTQRLKFQQEIKEGKSSPRFIQTKTYASFPNLFVAGIAVVYYTLLGILAQFKFGVNLCLKYPTIFSLGVIPKHGLSDEDLRTSKFKYTVIAKGWQWKDKEQVEPPNKTMALTVSGSNPSFGAASVILLHAGLALLEEKDRMPERGGVYSPGMAFARTTLVQRLNRFGVPFELLK